MSICGLLFCFLIFFQPCNNNTSVPIKALMVGSLGWGKLVFLFQLRNLFLFLTVSILFLTCLSWGWGPLFCFLKTLIFLDLTFDTKLSWLPHLKDVKQCLKALWILKCFSHADRTCLLPICRAFVTYWLDCGCMMYGSARPHLKKLEHITSWRDSAWGYGILHTSHTKSLCRGCWADTSDTAPPGVPRTYHTVYALYTIIPYHYSAFCERLFRTRLWATKLSGFHSQVCLSDMGVPDFNILQVWIKCSSWLLQVPD